MLLSLLCVWAPGLSRTTPATKHRLQLATVFVWPRLHNLVGINLCDTHTISASPQTPQQGLRYSPVPISIRCHRFLDRTSLQPLHHRVAIRHCAVPYRLQRHVRQHESAVLLPVIHGIPINCNTLPWFQVFQGYRDRGPYLIMERHHVQTHCLGRRHYCGQFENRCQLHRFVGPWRLSGVC